MKPTRWIRRSIGVIAILASVAGSAAAQVAPIATNAFPARPITLIVPFPAGGPSDALARAVAQGMSSHLKQPIVVENIAGASGTIGLARLVKAAPDGYTIAFGTVGTHVANAALYKKLPYDPLTDFDAVGLGGTAPTILVARPQLPASNLPEFVAYAGANSATATYGSAGVGSISHFACVSLLSALKIRALAVLTDRRLPQLPEVATAASYGYGDVNIRAWNALFAPKGTPAPIIRRLNDALRLAVADPGLRRQMEAVGVDLPEPDQLTPGKVSELIAAGLERDVPALRARGEYLD
jgi:tripartite-type tricarboxylate transporter receptor subunit TctC